MISSKDIYPSIVTLNTNTFSPKSKQLARNKENIRALSSVFSIIALQQLRLLPSDKSSLYGVAPGFTAFYNNYNRSTDNWLERKEAISKVSIRRAGTAFLVRNELLQEYRVVHRVIVPGHAQVLEFFPKDSTDFQPLFFVCNVYFYTGKGPKDLINASYYNAICAALSVFPANFFLGDWNFIENHTHSTSGTFTTARVVIEARGKFVDKYGLRRVPLGLHTFFRFSDDLSIVASSEIDAILAGFSEADLTVMAPTAFTPPMPHGYYTPAGLSKVKPSTDHIAVGARFLAVSKSVRSTYCPPSWVIRLPIF